MTDPALAIAKPGESPLARLELACRLLAEARSLDEVKVVVDLAEAARVYARQAQLGLDAQNNAAVTPRNRPPERPRPSGLTSPTLQPFVEYLQGRWQAGCTNVAQLQRELEAQGYQGSYSLLMQALTPWRGPRPPLEPGRGRDLAGHE